jgi:hypothetical protein
VVYANDGALGIGLKDRAQWACEGGQDACGFWVEAYWRGKQHLGYQLDVMSIQGPIDVLAAAGHVSVEAETGN